MSSRLVTRALRLSYGTQVIVDNVDLTLPDGELTAIVGPNACGKSTLLRALARLMQPLSGQILLDGADLRGRSTREVAQVLGLLPQAQTLPEGLRVQDLVARGRFPHQSFLRRWSAQDDAAVERALETTGLHDLRRRQVDQLSGGQRQRVWLATVLAQDPPLVLLDEPTTFLDLTHQLDMLDVLAALPTRGHTVVAVLHDLNLAARYASHMIAMSAGKVIAQGTPEEVLTEGLAREAFGLECRVLPDPETGTPMVVPLRRTPLSQRDN